MKKTVFILLLLCAATCSYAQQSFTLSGYVKDGKNGEVLIGATIGEKSSGSGTSANAYGFYSLQLPKGKHTISFSYLGFGSRDTVVDLSGNVSLNIELISASVEIHDVVITTTRKDENVSNAEMGKVELNIDKIKSLPVIFGEVDILKTIQLLPGVVTGGEGNSGFYVRGGSPDQNLILLDEAVVYNSGHLFGFFSIFNGDALLNTTLYKGGMPANYGGRISSVLDVNMKEGNNKSFHTSGGIGLISSRLLIEGPLKKNKSSFMISGRRTYIDQLLKPFIKKSAFNGSGYYFYDLNMKLNYSFSDKDRIFASGYFGKDIFSFAGDGDFKIKIPWGNFTSTVRWNHLFSKKLFSNISAIYNSYNFQIDGTQGNFEIILTSGIRDWNLKSDFDYYLNARHAVKFGANYTFHTFMPNSISGKAGDVEFKPDVITSTYAHDVAFYALDKWDISEKLQVNYGLRFVVFDQIGPYNDIHYDAFGKPSDTVKYSSGQHVVTYSGLEPRFTFRYKTGKTSSVKGNYTINNQFVHLVSNNGNTLPTDIWVPSTLRVKPQIGTQASVGYFRNFKENTFEASVEVYFKYMKNQIEYRDSYTPEPNEDLEKNFVFGYGESAGLELFLNKQYGKLTGWIGYTLSKSIRLFDDLNHDDNGVAQPFRSKYDRTHDLSVVASYTLGKHWQLGGTFIFASGNLTTLPESYFLIENLVNNDYGPINSYRLPSYNRLDISATWARHKHEKWECSWTIGAYNVYNRHNVYFIYFSNEGDPLKGELVQKAKSVSIFPILPSITWNFKF